MKMWQFYLALYVLTLLVSLIAVFTLTRVIRDIESIAMFLPPAICLAVFIYRNAPPLKK